jgi:hypothetical protein
MTDLALGKDLLPQSGISIIGCSNPGTGTEQHNGSQ